MSEKSQLAHNTAELEATGISLEHSDESVRTQDDLFRAINGTWLREAKLPADRSTDGAFRELYDRSEQALKKIIENAAGSTEDTVSTESAQVGKLYASFLNETHVESLGFTPIQEDLRLIEQISNIAGFSTALGALEDRGVNGFFGYWVNTDAKKSDEYILYFVQSGIGLPDESYYRDETKTELVTAYREHIGSIFGLIGLENTAERAHNVVELEREIASFHWDQVRSRDSDLTYNKHSFAELQTLTPGFDWTQWSGAAGLPTDGLGSVIVEQPSFFEGFAQLLTEEKIESLKDWLRWQTVRSFSPYLSKEFVDANFAFYGKTLSGTPQIRERWKRGVALVEGSLGEALGKLYVSEHFPAESKERVTALVDNLLEAYRQSISTLPWLSDETKPRALDKLEKITLKIGYPDTWKDYSGLEIKADDLVGNVRRVGSFVQARELKKLGSPVDRGEWFMTPQTVNAYYNPGMNEIVFPAAILQPPFFSPEADDAVNYGGIGAVIGHEIGHAFDDQGSKFDGDGNLNNWWNETDRAEFEKRTSALIEQYNGYAPAQIPEHHVNGAFTIGENIGDLGGAAIALKAYTLSLGGTESPKIAGTTGEQRFFYSWAQIWRAKSLDEEAIRRLAIDPHSPPEFRCNGPVRNLDEFYEAFSVTPSDALWLAPEQRVHIW